MVYRQKSYNEDENDFVPPKPQQNHWEQQVGKYDCKSEEEGVRNRRAMRRVERGGKSEAEEESAEQEEGARRKGRGGKSAAFSLTV